MLAGGVAYFGPHATDLDVDTSTRVLLNEDDPDLAYYESTRPIWGYDEYAIVCATRDEWISADGVATLKALVADLAAIPYVRGVTSILDVPLLRQTDAGLLHPGTIKALGDPGIDFAKAREEMLHNTQAAGSLISTSDRDVGLLVHLEVPEASRKLDPLWSKLQGERLTNPKALEEIERLRPQMEAASAELRVRDKAMVDGIRNVAAKWAERLPEPLRLSGTPIIRRNIEEHIRYDLRTFGIACFALFILAFAVIYRRVRFVVLPVLTALIPVAMITGAMALLDLKLTITTASLPLLLFVLLLPYAVYFLERYRERRADLPGEPGFESTFYAARKMFVPCLFSCLTTVAGFASLLTSPTHPVRSFGLMMSVGMVIGLFTVFLAIPALARPLPPADVEKHNVARRARGLVRVFEAWSVTRPKTVVFACAVAFALAILGALRVSAQSKFTEYFWPSSEVHRGLEVIDTRLGGTTSLEIILQSKQDGFFFVEDGLKALRAASRWIETVPETGNVRSLATLADELDKKAPKAHALLPMIVRLPQAKVLVSDLVSEDGRTSRVFVRMRETAPSLDRHTVLDGLRADLATEPALQGVEVHVTGIFLLYANMLDSLVRSQRETFLMVVAAVWLMLLVLFRSLRLSFVTLLPQALPVLAVLGVMGWASIPLDLVTVMIASISMGVGIDAAIQYVFRWRAEMLAHDEAVLAVRRTHASIGRAIWIATTVMIAGFLVLALSNFVPTVWFGCLVAVAMLMGQIAALTLLPSLLVLTSHAAKRRAP